MDRVDSRKMKRAYGVSPDEKTLTLCRRFHGFKWWSEKTTTVFARTVLGKSIFGEWKSASMEEKVSGPAEELMIEPLKNLA
jgi:hypothetical protein